MHQQGPRRRIPRRMPLGRDRDGTNRRSRGSARVQDGNLRREMGLEIKQREREGISILDLNGRITTGEEATLFRETIHKMATAGVPNLILNLAEVEYIDSTGLGAIVVCSTAVRKAGGAAKLLNLSKRTVELLVMTKLATI